MKIKKLFLILTAVFFGGIAMAQNSNSSKKILVAYFSWGWKYSRNCKGICKVDRS